MSKLTRDTSNQMFFGVCSGFARRLDVEVVYVRLFAAAALFVSFGTAAILYLIASIVIPEE